MVSQSIGRSSADGQASSEEPFSSKVEEQGSSARGTFGLIHHNRRCSVLYRDYLRVIEKRCTGITEIVMSPKKIYQCTRPLIYCAAYMLGAILFRLNGVLHKDSGVKLSYREIAEDLIGEYSQDFIAVAGRLLVQIGLLEPPTQDGTWHRALIWKVSHQEMSLALADLSPPTVDMSVVSKQTDTSLSHDDRKCSVLYRDILTVVQTRSSGHSTVQMSPKKAYRRTKPLTFCASKVLSTILFRLNRLDTKDLGVKLSYREIAGNLIGQYSEGFIAVAGRLLVQIGLLEPPIQDATWHRALIWKVPCQEMSLALDAFVHPALDLSAVRNERESVPLPFEHNWEAYAQQESDRIQPSTSAIAGVDKGHTGSPNRTCPRCPELESQNTHSSTSALAGVDKGYTNYPDRTYPRCPELESQNIHLEQKREESDSIHSVLFSFFSSTAWSPEIVRAIIVALEVMPERKWERDLVDKQCLLVYEQMRELPPREACRRLILSLEYMKTTQVFWRGRFEQGKPIVLSLGSNHDGSHHHCLEMYEELTRRGWTSALEEAWIMEEMRQNAERGACMHMAVMVLAGLGLPSDHLDFDALVEIGRPHYARQNTQRSTEAKERESDLGISETTVESVVAGENIPFQADPVLMGQKEAQSLLDHISHMLPGIQPYLFCESTEQGGVSVCLAPPSDQSGGGVRLTLPADWERLLEVLDETSWNWNAAMIQLFGNQVSSPPDEQAGKYVQEVSLDESATGMDRDEAIDLGEQIAQEIPTLAPYLFWGPIESPGLATLELSPPCNSGVGVCLIGSLGWTQLREVLLKAQGDWDMAVALLFDSLAFSADERGSDHRLRADTVSETDRQALDATPNE